MFFRKMHGLGNDFVIFDTREKSLVLGDVRIRELCDRNRGIGCDQLIVIEPSTKATAFMRIYNPDGSEAGACGNATRCVATLLMQEAGVCSCTIETVSGVLEAWSEEGGLVRVNMGVPRLVWDQIPLLKECDTLHLPLDHDPCAVSMGNPHCVYFWDNEADMPVDSLGKKTEHYALFPKRTNVEFVYVQSRTSVRMRVWERGAGVTQACGSGACASAVAAIRRGLTENKVRVELDGGFLDIEWAGQLDSPVFMTGPVAAVFSGHVNVEAVL